MPSVVGYLRIYTRRDGKPDLTLEDQKALVSKVARDLNFGRASRRYLIEEANSEAEGWPVLRKVIELAQQDGHQRNLFVVPTLSGVEYNLSFLELLADPEWDQVPLCVRSGWRRIRVPNDKEFKPRAKHDFWQFTDGSEWKAFNEMVERVRRRKGRLPKTIKAGLEDAKRRGVLLGSRRPGAHRFTKAEQRQGGRSTAEQRRRTANKPYEEWIPRIREWRTIKKWSYSKIAMYLAKDGARTPKKGKIGPMLVCRILQRELK